MDILVLVKQVPNTSEIKIDKVTNTLIRKGVESIINPDDLAGVEVALKLKEQYGGTVKVVTMGPPQAESMIRELYGRGIDGAYLLTDPKFAGSDTLATSTILSSFIKTLHYDLIIAGYQAIDGDTAQVGPQVAEFLNIPQVSHLKAVGDYKAGVLRVFKDNDDEFITLDVKLPALITTVRTMNKPRYMNAWDAFKAKEKPFTILKCGDFPLDMSRIGLKGSPTIVSKTYTKQLVAKAPILKVSAQEASKEIMKLIYPYLGAK